MTATIGMYSPTHYSKQCGTGNDKIGLEEFLDIMGRDKDDDREI